MKRLISFSRYGGINVLSCGRLAKAFCLSCVVVFASCASVPKETAEMSAMLGRQLSVLKDTNGKMLERLYAEKEKNVARYVDEEWYPYWLEQFFSNPVTESVWDEAVRTDSMEYRMEIVQALTKICMDEYKSYKDSLLSQIQAERDSVTALCEEQYDKALRMNTAITRNVKSAAGVNEKYESLLGKVVDVEKMDSLVQSSLDRIDGQLGNLVNGIRKAESYEEKINGIVTKIKK